MKFLTLTFSIPVLIGSFTSLKVLKLSSNNLDSLPDEIGQLTNLHSLDVRNNDLLKSKFLLKSLWKYLVPDSLSNLYALRILVLGKNQIQEFPKKWFQSSSTNSEGSQKDKEKDLTPEKNVPFQSLHDLVISENQISSLPSNFFDVISKLSSFNLTYNKIKELPSSIENATSLSNLEIVIFHFPIFH